jgi:hypothetical protein
MKNTIKQSETHSIKTRCCELFITLSYNKEGNISRIYVISKGGGCRANLEGLTALLTYIAKLGNEYLPEALKLLKDIECKSCINRKGEQREDCQAKSCPDGISKTINVEIKNITKSTIVQNATVDVILSPTDVKDHRSKCCNEPVKTDISPDFIGDDPKTMTIGTVSFICTKCNKPCNV